MPDLSDMPEWSVIEGGRSHTRQDPRPIISALFDAAFDKRPNVRAYMVTQLLGTANVISVISVEDQEDRPTSHLRLVVDEPEAIAIPDFVGENVISVELIAKDKAEELAFGLIRAYADGGPDLSLVPEILYNPKVN
ncbi:hypothetical protein BH23PAT1_BH23PAT1_4420 [soil metagenome]